MRSLVVLLLIGGLVLGGCAFQAGPLNLAVGDTEASRCEGETSVEADGSYRCNGTARIARGSNLSDNFVRLFEIVLDTARAVIAGIGQGLASVAGSGTHESGNS